MLSMTPLQVGHGGGQSFYSKPSFRVIQKPTIKFSGLMPEANAKLQK